MEGAKGGQRFLGALPFEMVAGAGDGISKRGLGVRFCWGRRFGALAALALCALGGGHAAFGVTELPVLLQNGVAVSGAAGVSSSETVFRCVVPEGAKNLGFSTALGRGDANLYVRYGAHPTTDKFDWSSLKAGNSELVGVENPVAGVWYVMLHGFSGYSGVRVRMNYQLPAGRVADPVLSPGPGRFSGAAAISLSCPTRGAAVYYTTDGSQPTVLSARYRLPLLMKETTTLKAKAFLLTGASSGTADAVYEAEPVWPAPQLLSGVPAYDRSGGRGTMTYFKVSVPAGREYLKVDVSGGVGDTALYVTHSYFLSSRPRYSNGRGNLATTTVAQPMEGDWYIGLRGLSNYSGVVVTATLAGKEPDLIVWADACQPYVTTETFVPEDCAVDEGTIQAGTRRLLRFTTDTRNIGLGDLILGAPEGDPRFEFFPCHGHYHFKQFASYRLLSLQGELVGTGNKASFCLEDVKQWDPKAPRRENPFNCYYQGLHVGWSDIYDSGLPGQWVDITGVPAGEYVLEVIANPDRVIEEADYTNNTARVRVTIPEP
jgi:hypothetical protein